MINKVIRPTIIDVAREAKVSKSTVSLAMRNSPLLSEETLKHVQAVARRLGYRPNMLFSVMGSGNRLKHRKKEQLSIAYLYDTEFGGMGKDDMGDFRCLPTIAEQYGYNVDPIKLSDYKTAQEVEKELYYRGYCAVIIGRILNPNSLAYNLELKNFSVVSNTNTLWKCNFHRVSGDVFKAAQLAFDKAIEAGYRRIGCAPCRHVPSVPDDDLRLAAFLERQRHYGSAVEVIPICECAPKDYETFLQWVKKYSPEVVIGLHVSQYYFLKKKLPKKVFEKLSFCSLIVHQEDIWAKPLSGIAYPEKEVAEVTISILDQEVRNRIYGMPQNIMSVFLQPKWHEGETLKKKV